MGLDNVKGVAIQESTTFDFGQVVGLMLTIGMWLGILMIVWGGIQIGMSFMEDGRPEQKVAGFKWLIGGVICVSLKVLLTAFGFIATT